MLPQPGLPCWKARRSSRREAAAATHGEQHGVKELGPGAVPVTLHINGKEQTVQLEPRTTLADALRVHMGLTGTKVVCDRGVVFRLHRAAGQHAGEQLHDAGDGRDWAQVTTIEGFRAFRQAGSSAPGAGRLYQA